MVRHSNQTIYTSAILYPSRAQNMKMHMATLMLSLNSAHLFIIIRMLTILNWVVNFLHFLKVK